MELKLPSHEHHHAIIGTHAPYHTLLGALQLLTGRSADQKTSKSGNLGMPLLASTVEAIRTPLRGVVTRMINAGPPRTFLL